MALTLLRHTTPKVAKGVCYGRTDLPLATSFEAEWSALRPGLPNLTAIRSSPLGRCRALAQRIAEVTGLAMVLDEDLIEMDFGRWEGVPWSDIPRAELDGWADDFMRYDAHGGESVAMLLTRVTRALARAEAGAVLVCHAGVIKAALAADGATSPWDHQTPFGGMVTLRGGPPRSGVPPTHP